jgi:hypothetical protein
MGYKIFAGDCIDWLKECPPNSIHAVITDPPLGLLEYTTGELGKLRKGKGGVWRIPPEIGGCKRKPLPRFTVLSKEELAGFRQFFQQCGGAYQVLQHYTLIGNHLRVRTGVDELSEKRLKNSAMAILLNLVLRGNWAAASRVVLAALLGRLDRRS